MGSTTVDAIGIGVAAVAAKGRSCAASTAAGSVSGPTRRERAGKGPAYVHVGATRATATRPASRAVRPAEGTTGLRPAGASYVPAIIVAGIVGVGSS